MDPKLHVWIPCWRGLQRTMFGHAAPKQIGLWESSNDRNTLSVVDQVKKYFPMYGLALTVETDTSESEPSIPTAAPGSSGHHLYPPALTGVAYEKNLFLLKLDTSAETGRVVYEAGEDSPVFKREKIFFSNVRGVFIKPNISAISKKTP